MKPLIEFRPGKRQSRPRTESKVPETRSHSKPEVNIPDTSPWDANGQPKAKPRPPKDIEAIVAYALVEALATWGRRLRNRNDYQRDYMRDWRKRQKEAK